MSAVAELVEKIEKLTLLEAVELKKPDVRPDETEAKYASMFERRAKKGQCFNQPYLGWGESRAPGMLLPGWRG